MPNYCRVCGRVLTKSVDIGPVCMMKSILYKKKRVSKIAVAKNMIKHDIFQESMDESGEDKTPNSSAT